MDKIFDLVFSPRTFFKTSKFDFISSVTALLIVWFVNVLILFPSFKNIPFFGGFYVFSIILLGLMVVYYLLSVAIHRIAGKGGKKVFFGFSFVLFPHVMSGWIFSMGFLWKWAFILLLIPILWSIVLEFYLVRSSMGYGMIYTIVVRITRDIIYFVSLYAFLKGWFV